MTNDEIIRLAREAGDDWDHTLPPDREFLLRFGALVAAAAEAAEGRIEGEKETSYRIAAAIRARGQA
jgi:hypothetical protein